MAETINADMGANVWKVLVAAGDPVEPDTTIVVLESMKMEIPVLAEYAGSVTAVHVTEGSAVQAGDPLVDIEEP
ncbi:biotin/lipoyl-binding carrier protein [Amycolatopsis jejuensis]|uniref:biotin/lipoyl-binding carrier protein n=1 Tax=Amycolatopsis jejuensis TaxID=330084 RepID=UPI0005259684|nr:biotin/lipoyl-binding carrier protein [Amycolatopsis jejuensis]